MSRSPVQVRQLAPVLSPLPQYKGFFIWEILVSRLRNRKQSATIRTVCITSALLFVLAFTSCRKNTIVGERPDTNKSVITVSQALEASSYDRVVTVKGTIKSVCQDEGCWMTITDGQRTMRMTFKDEAFRVGLKASGDVLVTGIVHEEIVSEEVAKAIGPSIGLSEGSVRQLTGDQRWPLMTTSGVEFLQPQP